MAIDFPPDFYIKKTIQEGSVYYYVDEGLNSSDPHYFIVLNSDPLNSPHLVLVCATSQLVKKLELLEKRGWDKDTLVLIPQDEYEPLTTYTAINCNSTIQRPISFVVGKLKSGASVKWKKCPCLPNEILHRVKVGVLTSNEVPQEDQELISIE